TAHGEFRPIGDEHGRRVFVLPRAGATGWLVSRSSSPSDARPWSGERRRLGVMVRRLAVRSGRTVHDIAVDDPALTGGWWPVEGNRTSMWRWTNGNARLPLADDVAMVEVELGGTPSYPTGSPA